MCAYSQNAAFFFLYKLCARLNHIQIVIFSVPETKTVAKCEIAPKSVCILEHDDGMCWTKVFWLFLHGQTWFGMLCQNIMMHRRIHVPHMDAGKHTLCCKESSYSQRMDVPTEFHFHHAYLKRWNWWKLFWIKWKCWWCCVLYTAPNWTQSSQTRTHRCMVIEISHEMSAVESCGNGYMDST